MSVAILLLFCTIGVSVALYYQQHPQKNTELSSSTIPVDKGGTGCTSISELKKKLNIQSLLPVSGGGTGVSNINSLKSLLGLDPNVIQPLLYASGNSEDAKLVNPTMFYDVLRNTYTINGFYTQQTSGVEIWGILKGSIVSANQKKIQGKLPFPVDPAAYTAVGSVLSCWAGTSTDDSTDWVASPGKGFIVQQTNGSVYIYVNFDFGTSPASVGGNIIVTYMVKMFNHS